MKQYPRIIFVEDDPDDRGLIVECLEKSGIDDFEVFESGFVLLKYLEIISDGHLPEVIVLDLNMPVMNGYQVLKELKSIDRYQQIPVFLFTTSQRLLIVEQCIREGAAGYYQKPTSMNGYNAVIRELYQFVEG